MTPGSHIELDLIELIEMTDYVDTEVGLQKGTSCIVPVTAVRGMKSMLQCSVQYVEEQTKISVWDFANSVSRIECVFYPNLNLSETLP